MILEWTKHLSDPEEREKFVNTVKGSQLALNRLKEIVDAKEETLNRKERSADQYDNSNWANLQAHLNGNREMLHWFRTLLTLDQKE
jgi:hypothetical protein